MKEFRDVLLSVDQNSDKRQEMTKAHFKSEDVYVLVYETV